MGKFKVYVKRGAPNHREQKLMSSLQRAIDEKMAIDPNFKIEPARSFAELQKLHTEYCTEVIDFEEVVDSGSSRKDNSGGLNFETTQERIDELNKGDVDDEDYDKIVKKEHPMVKDAPKVRDYVLGEDGFTDPDNKKGAAKSSYDEPKDFDDSFKLPDEEVAPANGGTGNQQQAIKKEKPKPINPSFDDMDTAKQKRKSKQFARNIVSAICTAAKFGFVWYANKDINEAKLVEYELEDQIDLGLLLSLEQGQQVTVREWFLSMNIQAEKLSDISEEDQDDLTDALTDVLLEKGFVPTPVQQLAITAGTIILGQSLKLASLKLQTNEVLNQLRLMKKNDVIDQPTQHQQQHHQQQKEDNIEKVIVDNNENSQMSQVNDQNGNDDDQNDGQDDLLAENSKKDEIESIAETAIK